jgi:hypothetical protein
MHVDEFKIHERARFVASVPSRFASVLPLEVSLAPTLYTWYPLCNRESGEKPFEKRRAIWHTPPPTFDRSPAIMINARQTVIQADITQASPLNRGSATSTP